MAEKFIQILVSDFPIAIPPGHESLYAGQWYEAHAPKDWDVVWLHFEGHEWASFNVSGYMVSNNALIEQMQREGIVLSVEHRHPSARKYSAPLNATSDIEFAKAMLHDLGWLQVDVELSSTTRDLGDDSGPSYFVSVAMPPALNEALNNHLATLTADAD